MIPLTWCKARMAEEHAGIWVQDILRFFAKRVRKEIFALLPSKHKYEEESEWYD